MKTTTRLLETTTQLDGDNFPLMLTISDGLDGSGSHKIYNQFEGIPQFNKNFFILFAFKVISIIDTLGNTLYSNEIPDSPFCVRSVVLLAQKENAENTKFLMDSMVNPEVASVEQEGLLLPQGKVEVKILRTMFGGKCLVF